MWKTNNRVLNEDTQSAVISSINKDGKVLTKDSDMLEALIVKLFLLEKTWLKK